MKKEYRINNEDDLLNFMKEFSKKKDATPEVITQITEYLLSCIQGGKKIVASAEGGALEVHDLMDGLESDLTQRVARKLGKTGSKFVTKQGLKGSEAFATLIMGGLSMLVDVSKAYNRVRYAEVHSLDDDSDKDTYCCMVMSTNSPEYKAITEFRKKNGDATRPEPKANNKIVMFPTEESTVKH